MVRKYCDIVTPVFAGVDAFALLPMRQGKNMYAIVFAMNTFYGAYLIQVKNHNQSLDCP